MSLGLNLPRLWWAFKRSTHVLAMSTKGGAFLGPSNISFQYDVCKSSHQYTPPSLVTWPNNSSNVLFCCSIVCPPSSIRMSSFGSLFRSSRRNVRFFWSPIKIFTCSSSNLRRKQNINWELSKFFKVADECRHFLIRYDFNLEEYFNIFLLTLTLLAANLVYTKWCKKNDYWNLGSWVLIWEHSVRDIQSIPTRQGFDDFKKSLRSCAWEESSLSIGRVKRK